MADWREFGNSVQTLQDAKALASHPPLSANPKDVIGALKINTFLFPSVAVIHGAHAMMDGAQKYGPYNWRDKKVLASIYIAAADRHLKAWTEREEKAGDSGVHHLGHAMACLAILLDAQASGNLIDDRPVGCNLSGIVGILHKQIVERANVKSSSAPPVGTQPGVVPNRGSVGVRSERGGGVMAGRPVDQI